ncbi:sensor histidine kinase [Sphaerisporangium siamense]|uniref:histidine kinase n=1 Tax=Sphaerisporangium siamense TaxID=795645 RepID=A0A7W7D536_9ACTN|nr:ATP-binding protein [Sphaerisporangium siamense]MBB4700332.1 signal transduction histidine kinase [Sphaerisporangium siamense]GII87748.1 sensor histidine kinase [Sphaerisporangium siamense]
MGERPPGLAARLREIELFAELSDEQLGWLAGVGTHQKLADGDVLFHENEPAGHFYVLLGGELLFTKVFGGQEHVLTKHIAESTPEPLLVQYDGKRRAAHQFTGELPLLTDSGYIATAISAGGTELMAYDKATFLDMLTRCPEVSRVLLPVLAWRIRTVELEAGRNRMLEGLGTLAAGLAHELNNPTAAMVRAAGELRGTVGELTDAAMRWGRVATASERRLITRVCESLHSGAGPGRSMDVLEAAEIADEVMEWLFAHDIDRYQDIGTALVDRGLGIETLDEIAAGVRPEALEPAIGCLGLIVQARTMVEDVAEAGRRIEALVDTTKAYTNLDRAPVRDVDLWEGLEATLAMLAPRLSGVRVRRHYGDVPLVTAYPSELNQVWTNLIDNAVDAMEGLGELRISTKVEGHHALVEIMDSGPGIPQGVLSLLFQPFFTTKDTGRGTGLGLHLSRYIVSHRHGGTIDVTSVPGDTRFLVRLPLTRRQLSAR